MQKQDNFVRLSGRIVNRYDRGKVTILTLSVAEMVRKEVKINYPKVYFFHEDKTGAEEFLVKDEVSIIAHVATPRKIRQSNGQEYVSQALVGDSIEKRKGMYELLNIPDAGRGPLEPQMNSFIITGTLSSIRKTGDRSAQIIVATPEAFNMQIGNRVTVMGKVVTGFNEPRNEGEKRTYYQNLVGLSIRKSDTKEAKPVTKEEVTFA